MAAKKAAATTSASPAKATSTPTVPESVLTNPTAGAPEQPEPTKEEKAARAAGVAAAKTISNDLDERLKVSTAAAESLIDRAAKATGVAKDAIQSVRLAADANRPGANAVVTFATTGHQVNVNLDASPDSQGDANATPGSREVEPIFESGENPLTPPAVMTDPITATNPISGTLVDGKSVVKDVPAAAVAPLESLALTVGVKDAGKK